MPLPLYSIKKEVHLFVELKYNHPKIIEELSSAINNTLDFPFLTLCIGSDRCIGDCLGPMVGHELKKNNFPYPVYGTLEHPVHAINLVSKLTDLHTKYPNMPILAIDASLEKYKSIGKKKIKKGAIAPGKGVGKTLPQVGNYSLVGIVDTYNHIEELTIHQVRLHLIHQMANVIAESLLLSIKNMENQTVLSNL